MACLFVGLATGAAAEGDGVCADATAVAMMNDRTVAQNVIDRMVPPLCPLAPVLPEQGIARLVTGALRDFRTLYVRFAPESGGRAAGEIPRSGTIIAARC